MSDTDPIMLWSSSCDGGVSSKLQNLEEVSGPTVTSESVGSIHSNKTNLPDIWSSLADYESMH